MHNTNQLNTCLKVSLSSKYEYFFIDSYLPDVAIIKDNSYWALIICQALGYALYLNYPNPNSLQPSDGSAVIVQKNDHL